MTNNELDKRLGASELPEKTVTFYARPKITHRRHLDDHLTARDVVLVNMRGIFEIPLRDFTYLRRIDKLKVTIIPSTRQVIKAQLVYRDNGKTRYGDILAESSLQDSEVPKIRVLGYWRRKGRFR